MLRTTAVVLALISLVSVADAKKKPKKPFPLIPLPMISLPIVTKTNSSGFTMADFIRNETCELYADRVVITKSYGLDHTITETRMIDLAGDIMALLQEAADDELTQSPNFLCDAPGTLITAGEGRLPEAITLFSSGGCGQMKEKREGGASARLKDMILTYCPTVNSFGFDGE